MLYRKLVMQDKAKAELILQGFVQPLTTGSQEEAIWFTSYILSHLENSWGRKMGMTPAGMENKAKETIQHMNIYTPKIVKHMCVNTLHKSMPCITYTCDEVDGEEPFPDELDTPDGVFSYVYNWAAPDFSEFGYCFFELRDDGFYHRIG